MKYTKTVGAWTQGISGVIVAAKVAAGAIASVAATLAALHLTPPTWLVGISLVVSVVAGIKAFDVNPDGSPAAVAYRNLANTANVQNPYGQK